MKKIAKSQSNATLKRTVTAAKRAAKTAKNRSAVAATVPVAVEDSLAALLPTGLSVEKLIAQYVYPPYANLAAVALLWSSISPTSKQSKLAKLLAARGPGGDREKIRVAEFWENCAARGLIPAEWLTTTAREFLGGCSCGANADRYLENFFHAADCVDRYRPNTAALAVAMASDPTAVVTAEQRLQEACAALVPWGLEPLKKIIWSSDEGVHFNLLNEWDFESDASAAILRASQAPDVAMLKSRKIEVIRERKRVLRAGDEFRLMLRTALAQRRKPRQRKRRYDEMQEIFFEVITLATAMWQAAERLGLKVVDGQTSRRKSRASQYLSPREVCKKAFSSLRNPFLALFALFETGVDWVAYKDGCALLRWQTIEGFE